ncbi:hypothetical protein [Novosphingobium pentaromativorans]|uniref:Uncharacterized protein n=1 Tax=Novosphingobium pentaromativorans US6-1 TaxID=1088721 RepID=G6E7J6_9SPHN|nr:hypothetical protein [Novosphingobium pentaromativorans]AIT81600.1 hypothetical protein JI59_18445 [Novosphingobium pentaromativorans US6-1]EHJ62819.1 hypothetical protein NSU_0331 [Novosphingobium pentaromativorans US6-1]
MAVTYNTAVKTARITATRDYFANGTLELLAANDAVLAIFDLSASGGSIAADTWTLGFDANTVAAEAGAGAGTDATKAQIKDSGGNAHLTGLTVGISGTDIVLDNVNIADGQNVTLSSAAIQHA